MYRADAAQVTLSQEEILVACLAGVQRRIKSIYGHFNQTNNGHEEGTNWTNEITGCVAEIAYAKWRNIYWSALSGIGAADTADGEIRGTEYKWGSLLIREKDANEKIFILVTTELPVCRIIGWMRAGDAKQDRWWKAPNNRPGAWFVPQEELHPMDELLAPAGELEIPF